MIAPADREPEPSSERVPPPERTKEDYSDAAALLLMGHSLEAVMAWTGLSAAEMQMAMDARRPPEFMPCPATIRERAEQVQAGWSKADRENRTVMRCGEWELPTPAVEDWR